MTEAEAGVEAEDRERMAAKIRQSPNTERLFLPRFNIMYDKSYHPDSKAVFFLKNVFRRDIHQYDHGVVEVAVPGPLVGGVEEAFELDVSMTFTVRAATPVFPAASVALYVMVCMPATDASMFN